MKCVPRVGTSVRTMSILSGEVIRLQINQLKIFVVLKMFMVYTTSKRMHGMNQTEAASFGDRFSSRKFSSVSFEAKQINKT